MTYIFHLNAPSCTDEPGNNLLAYTGTLNNDECNRFGDKLGWFVLNETRADVSLLKPRQLKTLSSTPTVLAAQFAATQELQNQ